MYTTTTSFRAICRVVLFCFTFATFHPVNLRVPWTLCFTQWTFDFGPPPAYGKAPDQLQVVTSDTPSRKTAALNQSGLPASMVRLPGHVLPALAKAQAVPSQSKSASKQSLTLTLVLKRDDQPGFDQYRHEVYDPSSPNYRKFLTQSELSDRFGPSPGSYDALLSYLRRKGFARVEGSANRMTIAVSGTRAQIERTFGVHIREYQIGEKTFYANDRDPALPQHLASSVQAVNGLSNLATPHPAHPLVVGALIAAIAAAIYAAVCAVIFGATGLAKLIGTAFGHAYSPPTNLGIFNICSAPQSILALSSESALQSSVVAKAVTAASCGPWDGIDGTGQTIGLVQFDTFQTSDVADYLALIGAPASLLSHVSRVPVNGGATPGPNQNEVLLDIDIALTLAPGANIIVYDAPFGSAGNSYQPILNQMINDGVTIISNSWSYCESQTTEADVNSIDALFQTAAASGISVFNAAGDSGSTCLDGSANTIGVPAGAPNATAVGGTSLTSGPGFTYESETWWNGTNSIPSTGQGGFGVSRFFPRPSYQAGFNPLPNRSIPDVSINADPARGVVICQANKGGCPTGLLNGGTSGAAPMWAAFTALLNQAQGQNLGFLNPLLYPLANTDAFHNAASMGSDFAHVGLGSPHLAALHLLLCGQTVGPPDSDRSQVLALAPGSIILAGGSGIPADGNTTGRVQVKLMDANGIPVSGKTVTLATNPGSQVTITPLSGVTSVDNGTVTFTITNLTTENVTFTATDTTDGITLSQLATMPFVTPPAISAGITANPTTVAADGVTTTTITVTLKDTLNRPTPGKLIKIDQGNGHSVISGSNPPVTDSNGQVTFTATNVLTETVTYNAIDVTDGDLPVPNPPSVNFTNGIGTACSVSLPTVANGAPFAYSSFVSGFPLSSAICLNPAGMAFDADGNLYVSTYSADNAKGGIYKFGPSGGTAGDENRLNATPYPTGTCASQLAFSKDGQHLYLARQFCGSGGNVVEVSTTTGAVIRTLATLSCATGLATDPISGDLFVSQACPLPTGSNNITRIGSPESATPSVTTYSSPGISGDLNFAPDGTLYLESLLSNVNQQFITNSNLTG